MFSEEMLREVPEALEKIFRNLQDDILADIVRRMLEMKAFNDSWEIGRTADWQLYVATQMRNYDIDVRKKIQKALQLSDKEVKHLFEDIISKGYATDKSLYDDCGIEFVPLEHNEELKQLIDACQEQAKGDLTNLTKTIGFVTDRGGNRVETLTQFYKDELNRATVEIASGAFDYDSTLKRVVNHMANSGIRSIDYESGYHKRIDTAARTAVMTGLRQITSKISDDNAKKLNTEYFEVSAHPTARPSHALWQGKIYTKAQLISICGYGQVDGLCGANCYHVFYPFIQGISKRKYSDEELSKIYKKTLTEKEWKGKKYTPYQATQRQRALERRMRVQDEKIKLLKIGESSKNDIYEAKQRRAATYKEYKKFSNAMELPEQMNRVFNSELKKEK